MAKICSKFYSLLSISYGRPEKGKTNLKKSCQSISFILKTDLIHLETSYVDGSACVWKQLKWNKFPFYGDRLCGKIIHGD